MFEADWLASEATRIVSTAGPLLTACFVFFVSRDLVKVDASIWGRDFFNMMHMFSLYIYTSFWTVGIQQPASMSQLSTCLNPMGLIWFLLKESSGKVCFHPVATSSPANSLSALDTVHRRIPETSLVLWFSLLQLRQLEGRKFSGVRAPKGKAYTSEACYKIPKVAEHLHNPSYLGKEAMVFVPPFNKQLKRA